MVTPEQAENIRVRNGKGYGSKLRRLRVKKGLSQSELASLSGIPKKSIEGYEQGKLNIDGAKLNAMCCLCAALGCKVGDILEDAELIKKYSEVK